MNYTADIPAAPPAPVAPAAPAAVAGTPMHLNDVFLAAVELHNLVLMHEVDPVTVTGDDIAGVIVRVGALVNQFSDAMYPNNTVPQWAIDQEQRLQQAIHWLGHQLQLGIHQVDNRLHQVELQQQQVGDRLQQVELQQQQVGDRLQQVDNRLQQVELQQQQVGDRLHQVELQQQQVDNRLHQVELQQQQVDNRLHQVELQQQQVGDRLQQVDNRLQQVELQQQQVGDRLQQVELQQQQMQQQQQQGFGQVLELQRVLSAQNWNQRAISYNAHHVNLTTQLPFRQLQKVRPGQGAGLPNFPAPHQQLPELEVGDLVPANFFPHNTAAIQMWDRQQINTLSVLLNEDFGILPVHDLRQCRIQVSHYITEP